MKNISDTHNFYDKTIITHYTRIYWCILCIAVIVKTNESKKSE